MKGILDPVHERYAHTGRFAAHDDRNPVCHGEDENNAQHFTGTGNKFANKFRFRNLVDGPQEQGTNKEDKGKFIKVPIAKFRIMTRAKQFTQDRDLGQAAERQIHHVLHGAAVSKLDGVPRHVPADKGQDNDHQQGDGPSFAARKFFHFVIFINKGLDIKTVDDGSCWIPFDRVGIVEHIDEPHNIKDEENDNTQQHAAAHGQSIGSNGPYGSPQGKGVDNTCHIARRSPDKKDTDPSNDVIPGKYKKGNDDHGISRDFFPQSIDRAK